MKKTEKATVGKKPAVKKSTSKATKKRVTLKDANAELLKEAKKKNAEVKRLKDINVYQVSLVSTKDNPTLPVLTVLTKEPSNAPLTDKEFEELRQQNAEDMRDNFVDNCRIPPSADVSKPYVKPQLMQQSEVSVQEGIEGTIADDPLDSVHHIKVTGDLDSGIVQMNGKDVQVPDETVDASEYVDVTLKKTYLPASAVPKKPLVTVESLPGEDIDSEIPLVPKEVKPEELTPANVTQRVTDVILHVINEALAAAPEEAKDVVRKKLIAELKAQLPKRARKKKVVQNAYSQVISPVAYIRLHLPKLQEKGISRSDCIAYFISMGVNDNTARTQVHLHYIAAEVVPVSEQEGGAECIKPVL